ncbi:DegT/DnrJ/EryC1/StrS family aminotransferase [Limnochorda pilosa]|uniref:Polysaccharide biosynthesis protein n=1 Tax=Limnochorda pilosa TaxID=1555112 RepID=A0A0K2SM78_LIMPI|nr:DegT/DnrJ/EryC1/StrS family aminotransferase [Limnochorda pilosa]BAS28216.1 polysaccharide biosynthesis protein [Limnochorda pilosa]
MKVPLSQPEVTEYDIGRVVEVLRSGRLSIGPVLEAFEEACAHVAGRRYAVGVNSGTSALHLAVRALGLGPGDEVITTPFSFVASSNCLLFEGATPVFVDIDPQSLNLDPEKVETAVTPRTRAILAVDVFGNPADHPRLLDIARRYGLRYIEDSCEALGSDIDGRPAGSFGDAGAFAFYPNKQITTGEGGMLLTDDPEVAALARSMRNQGRGESDEWLAHPRLGYNYRLDEISAALGRAQIERLEEIVARREQLARRYNEALGGLPGIRLPRANLRGRMSWFVYVVEVDEAVTGVDRDTLQERLLAAGVECKPYFPPIHLQPFYQERFGFPEGSFPVTERIARRTLALPFFTQMRPDQVERVAEEVRRALAA